MNKSKMGTFSLKKGVSFLVDKSSLRSGKERIIADVLDTLGDAFVLYFDSDDKDDTEYAANTIYFCKSLLNHMNF